MGVTKTKGKMPTGNMVINQIVLKNSSQSTQDISIWRSAIKNFKNIEKPLRTYLYDLYEDICLDGQIEATWGKRQDNILNKELIFVKDGVEDEMINKLLNSSDMRLIISEILNAKAWGYTLIQINSIWYDEEEETYRIDFDLIPRKHVHPERNFECISKEQNNITKDFLFKEPPLSKYMIWAGDAYDMGILIKAAQYVIYKRGGFGDWSQFAEMFGMPFREMIYDDYDDATRRELEEGLKNWGSAAYCLHPRGSELKIHDTGGSTGSKDVYDGLIKACDAAISKTILGNTMTTEQGDNGARALGDVHNEIEGDKKQSDEMFVLTILNTQLRAILKRFGINVQGGDIWYKSPGKDWNELSMKWNVVSGISSKIPVADDYIYEEFDIPKPDNYDELKENMKLEKSFNPFGAEPANPNNQQQPAQVKNILSRVVDFFV